MVTFGKCKHQLCWNITIYNEMRLEKDERFIVHLEKVDDYSSVVINVPRKEITIMIVEVHVYTYGLIYLSTIHV